jgi:small subunit ribosomal protein S1
LANPWEAFADEHPVGSALNGKIPSITKSVGLPGQIVGMAPHFRSDPRRPGGKAANDYRQGEVVWVKVLADDVENGSVSLAIE